jgi:hypothetical protein
MPHVRKNAVVHVQGNKDTHMAKHKQISRTLLFVTALCILAMGFIPVAVAAEDETEIPKITVGTPTYLKPICTRFYCTH